MISIHDMDYLFFYSERNNFGCFSNFWRSRYNIYGKNFSYSEQGFMYGKALLFGDIEIADQILNSKSPREAKDLGGKVKQFT